VSDMGPCTYYITLRGGTGGVWVLLALYGVRGVGGGSGKMLYNGNMFLRRLRLERYLLFCLSKSIKLLYF